MYGLMNVKTVIGLDVSKRNSWCKAISPETGEVFKNEKVNNTEEEFKEFVQGLPSPILMVMEATGNWQYLYECWDDLADEIQMAHPLKVKAIASAKIKTDQIDAGVLAHLGAANLVPQAYCPPQEVRDLREILRHRIFLVALRTRVKNRIHSYLWKLGVEPELTDLFGKKGIEWLKIAELRDPYRNLVNQDLKVLEAVEQEIKMTTQSIEKMAKADERAEWILPIQGIGKYSAMLILAEIGEIERFQNPKQLVSFAGLCPSTFQSGTVSYHGRITKQGSKYLRWILVEASQHYAKVPGRFGNSFRRIQRKKGAKTARVATAREILTSIYWCLKKKVKFEENPKKMAEPFKKISVQHAPNSSDCI